MSLTIQPPTSLEPISSLGIFSNSLPSPPQTQYDYEYSNSRPTSQPMSAMASGHNTRHPYGGYPPPSRQYDPVQGSPSQYTPTATQPSPMQRLPMMTPPTPISAAGIPPTSAPSISQSPILAQESGGFISYSPTTDPASPSAPLTLTIRQEPDRAKVVMGKDKDRKPVDPPPILQLEVPPQSTHILQSPYHFVMAFLIDEKEDKPVSFQNGNPLFGTQVSSLHKLKDTNNQDGGFFVFGDLSVRMEGKFRLKFILYEVSSGEVVQLGDIVSRVFKVFSPRHFPGMEESTFLTRSFSDQGVRLRLRKDSRSMTTRKRSSQVAKLNDRIQEQRYQPRPRIDSAGPHGYEVGPPQGNGWWPGQGGGPGGPPSAGPSGSSAPSSAGPYGGHGSPYGHDSGPPHPATQRYAPA